ncbi:DUF6151 family protein [Shimia sp. R9_3]|uniref:DUF6151 family protein n=1 Tax=Shimia sp. R9_3 TaxID=2821113 RepID=UPI001ADB905A|nr:DUF6151 family protein [Shimia sp. R9_3]MBO9400643.1 hypothetical protein [Shimia sp. R9_3]
MAPVDLDIGCRCGRFGAVLKDVSPRMGSHVQCHCTDCQTAARVLGAEDQLLPRGGSDIFQTTPAHLQIIKGEEHLACLRLSPKGLMRWYAACCDTPLFNCLPHTKLAFVGIWVPAMQGAEVSKAIGKVIAVVRTQDAPMGAERLREYGFNRAGFQVLARHFSALMRGQVKQTPLFDMAGAPVVTPRVLTKEERKSATP